MKLHYTKILLFFLPLNIFVSSSYAPNKNKPYITPHEPTTISRVLSECDLYTSNYDHDEDMKSVKENFDRQTSQRFEEYEERMIKKRQKCKEQCDKDIQEIIVKDKVEKTLKEKVEKGCFKCGCALGGGIAPVWGLISGLGHYAWTQYVSTMVLEEGIKKGLEEGLVQIMKFTLTLYSGAKKPSIAVTELLSSGKFTNNVTLFDMVQHINETMYHTLDIGGYNEYCSTISSMAKNPVTAFNRNYGAYSTAVTEAFSQAKTNAINAATHTTNALTTAIIASVVVIVVIALVMIIIYLILRYRRKKKMKKKQQYTKLLKE
ncbi:PIR protein, putative [Plasmodium sp.]|nr:PIR protein, putative [Plasmodium sp.]